MPLATTTYEHVALDDQGTPILSGANTKVIEIVLSIRAAGLSPEQLHLEMPHLSLGQIHSALAYYWDHKVELDADIEQRRQKAENLRQQIGQPAFVERLQVSHG